jgi:ATP-binding cassette, subfamily B, bacterial
VIDADPGGAGVRRGADAVNLRLIWRLARFRFAHYLASGLLIALVAYLLPLVPGLIVRQILDSLTGQAPAGWTVESLLALLVVVAVVHPLVGMATSVVESSLIVVVGTLLRRNVLERILERPGARALPASPGEAVSRFRNDVHEIGWFLTWTLDPLGQLLVFVVAVAVLARIDAAMTLLAFLPLLAVFLLTNLARGRIKRYRQANQEAIGEVTGLLGELYGAALAVKVAGAERRVVEHLAVINERRRWAGVRDAVLTQFVDGITQHTANVGTGLLLLGGAAAMRDGRFSVGDFALFVAYLPWLAQAASWFGEFLAKVRRAGVSLERLQELMQAAPPERLVRHAPLYLRHGPPPPGEPERRESDHLERLEARGLTYRYPGHPGQDPSRRRGIEGVDLVLPRGSFTVVTGRVGAGKTTLLRVLLGLLPRDAGEIRWNGHAVAEPGTFLVPPRAAYTPQVPRLFSETLRDNILMGLPERDGRLERALGAAALERDLTGVAGPGAGQPGHRNGLALGLETVVGPRGVRLSGGQLQRAAAARMFVREPELLVVDDLSSALDVETERELWERLAARPGVTCLAVSHRRPALRRADRIVVLTDGRVEDSGGLDELLARCAELRRLWTGEASEPLESASP